MVVSEWRLCQSEQLLRLEMSEEPSERSEWGLYYYKTVVYAPDCARPTHLNFSIQLTYALRDTELGCCSELLGGGVLEPYFSFNGSPISSACIARWVP